MAGREVLWVLADGHRRRFTEGRLREVDPADREVRWLDAVALQLLMDRVN